MPKTQGQRVVKFIEAHCVHPDGPLIGRPLEVHPWWKRVIYELFELELQRGEWQRRYTEAYISVPKKNAKTTMIAAIGLYLLIADDDPSAFIVSAAASEEQGANLLYGSAKTMCELSPTLKQLTNPMDKEIHVPSLPRARMRNVTSKAGTNDGLNAKAILCDELHEWKGERGRQLHSVLAGAVGARPNAMVLNITTAGFDQDSVCYEKYEYGRRVQSGEIDDPHFYFKCSEAPEAADHRDPKVWAEANPLLGISVMVPYLESRAKREPESVMRRYHLNQWVAAEDIWIPYGVWDKGLDKSLKLDPRLPLYVAIDIARNVDSSALAMVQRRVFPDGRVRYVCRSKIWENPYPRGTSGYESWRMNNNLVMEECRRLFAAFPRPATEIDGEIMPGPCFAYDPWRFRAEAAALQGEGLAMLEYPQTDQRMIPASQALYEAIIQEPIQVAHDGNPALKRHIHNVIAEQKERGWRISKPTGSIKKIDAAVALAIAVWCSQQEAPELTTSAYEDKELLIL